MKVLLDVGISPRLRLPLQTALGDTTVRGFLPFIGVQLTTLCVLLAWPSIVTLLL